MSDLAHERDRLHALVDQWIADREQDDVTDARVDQAALVALVAGDDEDGDEIEGVLVAWTTTRPHVQVGIARMLTLDLDDRVKDDE
jgi:hypothetical protein